MSEQTQVKYGSKPGVEYTLEVVEDLPESTRGDRSPLETQLAEIKANTSLHGKWIKVAEYDDSHASATAANLARRKHGRSAAVEGWTIQSKRFNKSVEVDGKTQEYPKTGLFVRFTPDGVVPGAAEEHFAEQEKRRKAQDERRKARDAEAKSATEKRDTAASTGNGESKQGQPAQGAQSAAKKAPAASR